MMRILLPICLLISIHGFSQKQNLSAGEYPQHNDSTVLKPISPDCAGAIKITLVKKGASGLTIAPNGSGKTEEIHTADKKSLYYFEREHNTAWYYFDIVEAGELVFEIVPKSPEDDYDFLLYKSNGGNFCDTLKKKNFLPVRTNISRSVKNLAGRTGLSDTSRDEFVPSGQGNPFSKSIHVKKGERYYLVLDNVHSGGGGHTININYVRSVEITGIVLNEQQKPIKAEVTISDSSGNDIKKTESDSVTGKYHIKTNILASVPYTLTFYNDKFFIGSKQINTDDLPKTEYKFNDIKTILPELKGGRKYLLGGINFFSGMSALLPQSYPSVKALYRLMKRNDKMIIRIEGHINNPKNRYPLGFIPQHSDSVSYLQLSEERAQEVLVYLLNKGIDENRMTIIGFGANMMLYPNPNSEEEQIKNRRVEINVISIK